MPCYGTDRSVTVLMSTYESDHFVNTDLHPAYSQEGYAIAVFGFASHFQHYETLIPEIDYYGRYGTDNIVGLLQVLVLWLVVGVFGFNQGHAKLDWFPSDVPLRPPGPSLYKDQGGCRGKGISLRPPSVNCAPMCTKQWVVLIITQSVRHALSSCERLHCY